MNPTKFYSSRQEQQIARYLGWNVVSGSGSRACHPGDILSDEWIGECKTHVSSKKPIEFKSEVWNKLEDEAMSKFKYPVLFVDDGSQKITHTWSLFSCSITLPSVACVFNYPKKFSTNMKVSNDTLWETFSEMKIHHGVEYIVSSVSIANKLFYLCRLDTFQALFGSV